MLKKKDIKTKTVHKPHETLAPTKVKLVTIISTILLFCIGLILIFAVLIYAFNMDNGLTKKAADIIPYPAATIGATNFITIRQVENRLTSVRRFYENQDFGSEGLKVDFLTPDGQKRLKMKEKDILNKLIEERIIERLANDRGISLSSEDVANEVDQKLSEYGSRDYLKDNLMKLYGWTIADFESNVVRPDLYREKLFASIQNTDSSFKASGDKIQKAQSELKNNGNFGDIAKKYSEGNSAKNGGELGWFSADQMLPEIAQVAFALNAGQTSDIIQSSIGYHIIQIKDKKVDTNGINMVKLGQIFVRTMTFADWLGDQEKGLSIHVPLRDYYWNKENGGIEFQSKDLQNFQDNLSKNSPNDVSMMF